MNELGVPQRRTFCYFYFYVFYLLPTHYRLVNPTQWLLPTAASLILVPHMEALPIRRNGARRANFRTRRMGFTPQTRTPLRQNGKPKGVVVKILRARLEEVLPLFQHKVVLAFNGTCDSTQARNWIKAFNEKSAIQLCFLESLINSLFAVTVDVNPERNLPWRRPTRRMEDLQ